MVKNVRDQVLNERNCLILLLLFILLVLAPLVFFKNNRVTPMRSMDIPVRLLVHHERKIYHLSLEDYLAGVVAAEMPAEFEMEALKAQAVAARTLAVKRLKRFGGRGCGHCPEADFCDDPGESQAWLSVSDLKSNWGARNFRRYWAKIQRALIETSGEIMTFKNRPVDAVFHSTCGVGTAAAAEIWNHETPYLQSEQCGFDRESARYFQQIRLSWPELSERLKISTGALQKMKVLRRTKTGRVLLLSIGKFPMRGEEFRKKAGLNSTCFGFVMKPSGVEFTVIGYGHGVGMCQYGANGMAKIGRNYHQILQHYYRGIQFRKIRYNAIK